MFVIISQGVVIKTTNKGETGEGRVLQGVLGAERGLLEVC